MKKATFIKSLAVMLGISSVLGFAGCSKSGNNHSDVSEQSAVESVSDSLEGMWQSEQLSDYIYTFRADGTGQYDMAGKVLALEYTTDEGKITLSFLEEGYTPVTLEYILDGDRLNIKDSFGKDTFYKRVSE